MCLQHGKQTTFEVLVSLANVVHREAIPDLCLLCSSAPPRSLILPPHVGLRPDETLTVASRGIKASWLAGLI